MKNRIMSSCFVIFFVIITTGLVFAACANPVKPNQTPVATDYIIGNLNQTAGSVTAVTITAKSDKSTGTVSNIRYDNNLSIPQVVGTYSVTFDVGAVPGWNAAASLSAGNLVVGNQTPVASDYTFGNLNQTANSVTAVTITANSGKSPGLIINIYYNGNTGIPQTNGAYAVTFDVAASNGWNAASGLSAGNLIVGNRTPVASDYAIENPSQTAGNVVAVIITANSGKSPGVISNIRYNGSLVIPQAEGTYVVTFDVSAATDWNMATDLSAGNLVVSNRTPVSNDYTVGNLAQIAGSVVAVTIIANSGKSPGAITNIYYSGNTIIPQTAGTYPITFDIAAAVYWNSATGLSAGNLVVSNRTPEANNYIIGNLKQIEGNVTPVTITAIAGTSPGTIMVFYNGSPLLPSAAGTYTVTFDVAAAAGWNAASGLEGGTLVITDFSGIIIGDKSVKLFLDSNTTPLLEGGTTTIESGTGTYTVSISPGVYSEIIWYLNGTVVSQGTDNTSLVLTKRLPGTYQVTVDAKAAGEKNTGNHFFEVQ